MSASPRVGVIWDGALDWATTVALRTLELQVLQRIPDARLRVARSGPAADGESLSAIEPPWVDLDSSAQNKGWVATCDVILALEPHGTALSAALEVAEGVPPAISLSAPTLVLCELAVRAQESWFAENRRGLMRALGWLPPYASTPFVVADRDPTLADEIQGCLTSDPDLCVVFLEPSANPSDAMATLIDRLPPGRAFSLGESAGVDELVAAVAVAQRHLGGEEVPGKILAGVTRLSAPAVALQAHLDAALAAADGARRSRYGRPDDLARRRAGTERALLQCRLLATQELAREATAQLAAVVNSRSWRFTSTLRAARRLLRG